MKKEEIEKLTVRDVIGMDVFAREMELQVNAEQSEHTKAVIMAGKMGLVYKRMPIDNLRDKGVFDGSQMVQLFAAVVDKTLLGFSATEREYIRNVGLVCFGRVLRHLQEEDTQ